jgi:hypothetical protein
VSRRDRERLEAMLERAADAVTTILTDGVERAQALFNERLKIVTGDE